MSNIVVITGANRGLGASLSKVLAGNGFRVLAVVRKVPERIPNFWWQTVCAELKDLAAIENLSSQIRELAPDGIFALINNAGIGFHSSVQSIREDELEETFKVNAMAPILLTSKLLDLIQVCDGRVVMITSRLVSGVMPFTASYTASKRALDGFAGTLRAETGLRVTCVEPGAMETDFLCNTKESGARSHFGGRNLARIDPNQVAEQIASLLKNDSPGYVERLQIVPKDQVF